MTKNPPDIEKNLSLLIKIQAFAENLFLMEKENSKWTSELKAIYDDYKSIETKYLFLQKELNEISDTIKTQKDQIEKYIAIIATIKEKEKYIKTQREYIALDTEISLKREEIVELEKEIKKQELKEQSLKQELLNKQSILKEKDMAYTTEKENIDKKIKRNEEKIINAKKLKEEIVPEVNLAILTRYENIVKNKNGIGIVPVVGGTCDGCNIRINSQLISKLRKNKEIIYCSNCARILYLEHRDTKQT